MDHSYIDEQQVAERYVLGQLSQEEADLFEEHYLHCTQCLDRLEAAEGLQRGLERVAEEEVARAVVARAGVLAAVGRLLRSRQAPLAVTLLLLVALLPSGLLLWRVNDLEQAVESRPVSSTPAPSPSPATPTPPLPPAVDLRPELEAVRGELAEERRRSEELAGELSRAREPQVNVPILTLAPERSAPGQEDEPTHRVSLAASPEWIVLALEVGGPDHPFYRAVLTGPDRQPVWQASGLQADATGLITLSLPTSLLRAGDFAVRLEGMPAAASPVTVARFSFRVTP
ncbi:MAG TPA: hypothetical protein VEL74_11675 [Thermoanaerobaculia bacterium]|nr:hypothetical protein [Thermoanaerobaculia bacterium]